MSQVANTEFESRTFRKILGKKSDYVIKPTKDEEQVKAFLAELRKKDSEVPLDSTNYDINQVRTNVVKI